jgi:CheY-like chemotaxis protein
MAEPRKKIVCIENDRKTSSLVAEHLIEWGFDPVVAYNGHEGFTEIVKQGPNLVLCEIKLPYMSGFEVLERLNELAPVLGHIPFVLLAADRENELRGRRLGQTITSSSRSISTCCTPSSMRGLPASRAMRYGRS